MNGRLDWGRDGRDWPHRSASRFVRAAGSMWHVQEMGRGPTILLVHGTAASTHSWAGLISKIANHAHVVALDLPGHAFTQPLLDKRMTLANAAAAVGTLLQTLNCQPQIAVGHSAGAAILVRMAHDGLLSADTKLIALNGALLPFGGFPGRLFSPLAKLLAVNPLVVNLFSRRAASERAVGRILTGTGSVIEAESLGLYTRLFRDPGHVAGALDMMANWDLETMLLDLARIRNPVTLVACGNDRAVPPDTAFRVRDHVPSVAVEFVRGLGHLAHEERPAEIARLLLRISGLSDPAPVVERSRAV